MPRPPPVHRASQATNCRPFASLRKATGERGLSRAVRAATTTDDDAAGFATEDEANADAGVFLRLRRAFVGHRESRARPGARDAASASDDG